MNSNLQAHEKITLSPAAVTRVKKMMSDRTDAIGFRIAVKPSGCSNYSYDVSVIEHSQDNDLFFEQEGGLNVYVDPNSYELIKGLHLDYIREGLNSKFFYFNPNEKNACGCGESFDV